MAVISDSSQEVPTLRSALQHSWFHRMRIWL